MRPGRTAEPDGTPSRGRAAGPASPTPAAGRTECAPGLALARSARELYGRGWMPGTSGNLSLRVPGSASHALITGSGLDKGALGAEDMVLVDADTARPVRARSGRKPSAETAIHAAVYRVTGARAVVHAHPPHCTALARLAGRAGAPGSTSLVVFDDLELTKGLGPVTGPGVAVPVFTNWPDVARIADEVAARLAAVPDAPPALLIAGHGVTVWGKDLAEARNRLECVESLCEVLLLTGEAATAVRATARAPVPSPTPTPTPTPEGHG
nr:methylthioribulose 1-phosphate dehydratase [Streptomyces sp. SID10853]